MTTAQQELVSNAREGLAAARLLFASGHFGFAAARAYYPMFYIEEAFLEGEGVAFWSHKEVIGAFGRLFTKTGHVPAEFHHFLIRGQQLRQMGDYVKPREVPADAAAEAIASAERFVDLAQIALQPIPPES